jgi:hypothetical protein
MSGAGAAGFRCVPRRILLQCRQGGPDFMRINPALTSEPLWCGAPSPAGEQGAVERSLPCALMGDHSKVQHSPRKVQHWPPEGSLSVFDWKTGRN